MTLPVSNNLYTIANGTTSSNPFIEVFETRFPTSYDINYPIQKRWWNLSTNIEYILVGFTSFNGLRQARWETVSPGNALLAFVAGSGTAGTFPVLPIAGNVILSSVDGTVTITGNSGTGTLDFSATGGAGSLVVVGNTGMATPVGSTINVIGAGSLTSNGAGSTLTFSLQNLNNHAVLVGSGTSTISNVGPEAQNGIPLISQGLISDPIFGTAMVIGGGTGSVIFNPNGVVISAISGVNPLTALTLTAGQVVIGTAAQPVAGTITGTGGVTVVSTAGSIVVSGTGGSFNWTDVTSSTQALAAENGYLTDRGAGVTYTLPSGAGTLIGDTIKIVGKLGITTVAQNVNQQILMASASSTVGITGSIVGTNVGDCIELICITGGASSIWRVANSIGNWTIN